MAFLCGYVVNNKSLNCKFIIFMQRQSQYYLICFFTSKIKLEMLASQILLFNIYQSVIILVSCNKKNIVTHYHRLTSY